MRSKKSLKHIFRGQDVYRKKRRPEIEHDKDRLDIKRHVRLFDTLAGVYGWGFSLQHRAYTGWTQSYCEICSLKEGDSVLDIGCGTGAWAAVWAEKGMKVTAVDPSLRMIQQSILRNQGRDIRFEQIDPQADYPYEDESFDMVATSLVLHGLKSPLRLKILREMKRISRGTVLIMDYNGHRNPVTDVIEWLEGGDYFHFQQHALNEMQSVFKSVEKKDLRLGLCFYICSD